MAAFSVTIKTEYQRLFAGCVIREAKYAMIDSCVKTITGGKQQYEAIAAASKIPWYFIGIVHMMECSCNFKKHLHNGDPLTAKTVRVPKGYPKNGNPPFTFLDSAIDALNVEGFTQWSNWSIAGMLYCFEKYNGFGYRKKNINSPYLWSGSNNYSKGKYVKDGIFDPQAVSSQVGTAVILRRMSELQIAIAGEKDSISTIKDLGKEVKFEPDQYHLNAEQLQRLLNAVGQQLRIDGFAGRHTSDAYQRISGDYLEGDIERTNA
ncbi:MAG: hypothetical protein ABIO76_01360 [Ginsengibacter sp.]